MVPTRYRDWLREEKGGQTLRILNAQILSNIFGLLKVLGLDQNPLPSQPAFKLYGTVGDVFAGGIWMHEDTNWEMHPDGDEALTLVNGRIDIIVETQSGEDRISLHPGESCVVPKGLWHRQIVVEPGCLLFHTYGNTTRHKDRVLN